MKKKLKSQEKRLVDLYLSSTLNVEAINHKNDVIKKEIESLNKKKQLDIMILITSNLFVRRK